MRPTSFFASHALVAATLSLTFTSPAARAQNPTWEMDVGPANIGISELGRPRFHTALDSQNNLIVAGVGGDTAASGTDLVWVEKLAPDGTSLWYGQWRNPNGRLSIGGLALDSSQHAYVVTTAASTQFRSTCCDSQGGSFLDNVEEQVTIKFSGATGDVLWTRAFTRPASSGISAHHITPDSLGRLVTSGSYFEPYLGSRQYRHVLNAAGQEVWTAIEADAFHEGPCAAAADGSVVCVNSGAPIGNTNTNIKIIKYSKVGKVQWSRNIDDKQAPNIAADLVVDHQDNVIVIGHNIIRGSNPSEVTCELLRMKLRGKNGQTLWLASSQLPSCILNGTSSTPRNNLGLVRTDAFDFIAIGNLSGATASFSTRLDWNTGHLEATATHPGIILARAGTASGHTAVISRSASGDILRRLAAHTLGVVSEAIISIGLSSFADGLAIVPTTGRAYVARTVIESVSGERHGFVSAND